MADNGRTPGLQISGCMCHVDSREKGVVNLFPNHGFSVTQLMADSRYKISAALSRAGLSNHPQAHQAVLNAAPRRPPGAAHQLPLCTDVQTTFGFAEPGSIRVCPTVSVPT